jgi:hypothetical protein
MIRVGISVEGQTEMEFCKKVLTPFLRNYDIELTPIVVATSRDKCGTKRKGGCINIDRIKSEVTKLLHNFDYVTTMYDFYGFDDRPTDDIDELEKIIYELFENANFIPYVQQYEFETLLFSKPEYYEEYFGDSRITEKMKQIIAEFQDDIEKINDSPQTAPSKRLEQLFDEVGESYDKVLHGEGIAGDIGIESIRVEAKRFNEWVEKIIKLGNDND